MHVAILDRPNDPLSLRLYLTNMVRELSGLGVEISLFCEEGPIPHGCDLVWDPGMCMRRIPQILVSTDMPIVGTMHGVKAFALGMDELVTGQDERHALQKLKDELTKDWKWFRHRVKAVVAVSNFAKEEVERAFRLPPELVRVIYHGVDQNIFQPIGKYMSVNRPYFLHVSRMDPVKNLPRILKAYSCLPRDDRPEFVVLATPEEDQQLFTRMFEELTQQLGVVWLRDPISQVDLAAWYRGALALILPSLRETFCLPVIEAMACGCPVVTSNCSGCAEVADDAAIKIEPRSSQKIAEAMRRVLYEPELREELREAGFKRAAKFAWERSASEMLRIFSEIVFCGHRRPPHLRKVEITTIAPCRLGCAFCPHEIFQRNYFAKNRIGMLDWSVYLNCLGKLSPNIGVSFGGMSEPFLNPLCADMVIEAKRRGHTISLFTTLVGLAEADLIRVMAVLDLGHAPANDRVFVHLPSVEGEDKIPVTPEYLACLKYLTVSNSKVEFHHHGNNIASSVSSFEYGDRLKHWPLHNRATNENNLLRKTPRKTGRIGCVMNAEVNIILPNGDVCLCCQDFGVEYVLGNLYKDSQESLYRSKAFNRILEGWADDALEIPCRYCSFAYEQMGS